MATMYDKITLFIPAKAKHVGLGRLTLSGIASQLGFSYEVIEDLKISMSEAITNSIRHAFKDQEDGIIKVEFKLYEDKLEVSVKDNGENDSWEKQNFETGPYEAGEEIDKLRPGGYGLYIIKTLMDEVNISYDQGFSVEMTKYIDKKQVGENAKSVST